MKLIECVPNFSEGRDRSVIDAIVAEITGTPGAALLDVDPGATTHRTVVTLAGPPEAVEEAAFRAIRRAAERIDMSRHRGEHPRMGATDVCPFVPMEGATLADCVELARRLGERVGRELGIPVYLYGEAATRPERRVLSEIRRGEYEALPEKLATAEFAPDFGPAEFLPRTGATVIGAREFLIAWNVNLNTRDKRLANQIAARIRETGSPKRDGAGQIVRDAAGNALRSPGRFRALQAGGWVIEEFRRAQVTCNLTDYRTTGLHEVFDACREEAAALGLRVTGSELVGLVPVAALLAAGDHYLSLQGQTTGMPESERVEAAVQSLGLGELQPFDPRQKVLEYRYRAAQPSGLVDQRLDAFVDELSRSSPTPGGGSVAAVCGALSAALASMVAALTWSRKEMAAARPAMGELGRKAQALQAEFLAAVDRDAAAFDAVLAARRLPKGSPGEIERRDAALAAANRAAVEVPFGVLERAVAAIELAAQAAREGNPALVSDAGSAGACGLAAAECAALNVRINLPALSGLSALSGPDGPVAAAEWRRRTGALLAQAREQARELLARIDGALDS